MNVCKVASRIRLPPFTTICYPIAICARVADRLPSATLSATTQLTEYQ